jgi:Yip1 domain
VGNGTRLMDSDYARIFVSPRVTIRAIVDRDPRDRVIAIAAIAGFVGALAAAIQFRSPSAFSIGKQSIPTIAPATMWKIRLVQVIVSPGVAIIFLYIRGSILRWSGELFGGTASTVEVRAALGWSLVPAILTSLILVAFTLIHPPAAVAASDPHAAWAAMMGDWPHFTLSMVLWLYTFVIALNCVAEVHRFSAWRALGAVAIEQLLILGAAIVIAITLPIAYVFLFR